MGWNRGLRLGILAVIGLAFGLSGCMKPPPKMASSSSRENTASGSAVVQGSASNSQNQGLPDVQKARRNDSIFGARNRPKYQQNLRNIGLLYNTFLDAEGKPPMGLDDFARDMDKETYDFVKEDYFVVFWNVDINRLPQGKSQTILGYENADIPNGRFVLYADGRVERISTDTFNQSPKAGRAN